jgi:hypothetical protein
MIYVSIALVIVLMMVGIIGGALAIVHPVMNA